ncbi:MAG: redox-sensing transcriptional repressor Rex [Spirochaetales bacterium]|nr:redox-sensing transcriptional repressor Rex [Spirochaetales bacterium]
MRERGKCIPELSIVRLCQMYRYLEDCNRHGITTVFSPEIGENLGVQAHTVRKDISRLGEIGNTAAGYDVKNLKAHIYRHLNLQKKRNACVVGLGRLGQAIINYQEFFEGSYRIKAGFDSNINTLEMINTTIDLYPSYRISEIVQTYRIELAVIAVPAGSAQQVCDRLVEGGVRGIINFAPVIVRTGKKGVIIRNSDLYGEFRILSTLMDQSRAPAAFYSR